MVTEQELESLLKAHGWSLGRRKTGKQYAYSAKKYRREGNITRYIAVTSTLGQVSSKDVLEKLSRPGKQDAGPGTVQSNQ